MGKYLTKEEVHNRALEAVGKTIFELQSNMDEKKSGLKSNVGDAWESWFEVEKNSNAKADLEEAGIELKATPIKRLKDGRISAKERLVLNIINYVKEFNKTFYQSSFWKKNQFIEIGFYFQDSKIPRLEWKIVKAVLYSFPEKDLLIIKKDWEKIHDYIVSGRAHELSEGLTMYLGACTKGANSSSLRKQHDSLSAPLAMQRAYSLKASYMTYILREYIFGINEISSIRLRPFLKDEHFEPSLNYEITESIVKDISQLENNSLDELILARLRPYKQKSVKELVKIFNLPEYDLKSKSIKAQLIQHMLGIKRNVKTDGDFNQIEEFFKANVRVKTISIQKNGRNKESMSFPSFKMKELINEKWETSTLRDLFYSTKIFFVVFEEDDDGEYFFKAAKFWNMSIEDLDTVVKKAWEKTTETLQNGVQLEYKNGRIYNNFIKLSDNQIIHVRPHTGKSAYVENSSYSDEMPNEAIWTNKPKGFSNNFMTKQCFWLNNNYIFEQIKDILD